MALTKRQKEVLDYLVAFETKHGYAPSFEEIGKASSSLLCHRAQAHYHSREKGFIRAGTIRAAPSRLSNCRSRSRIR